MGTIWSESYPTAFTLIWQSDTLPPGTISAYPASGWVALREISRSMPLTRNNSVPTNASETKRKGDLLQGSGGILLH